MKITPTCKCKGLCRISNLGITFTKTTRIRLTDMQVQTLKMTEFLDWWSSGNRDIPITNTLHLQKYKVTRFKVLI